MGYKAAVQILKQIDDLKAKVLRKTDLLVDSEAWTDQQKFQTICQQALLCDLEYALDKKVEQDLWNVGFKNHINNLQELTRDKKNSRRSECQALLTWCLEAASGFYLTLLHELCHAFDIELPFRRRGNIYGQTDLVSDYNIPQNSSCLYICQYCLVHLGDIARYRNQRRQAETFYKQAIQVSPHSGHPYNQLALLEASQGDKLSTVFYYIRGISVKNPFPAATTNLLSTLTSAIDKDSPLEKNHRKISISEFIQIFLTTHAYLHTATDLSQAEIGVHILNSTMTALVATQSFSANKLIEITTINLYALKRVGGVNDELTEDEKIVRQYILDLLAGSMSAFLVPVHTLKNDETLLDYYVLPAVKLLMYWIENDSQVLKNSVFANRLQIWPSLCKLLNNVGPFLQEIDTAKYDSYPLFEDRALQGFRPFAKMFRELNFKSANFDDERSEKLVRLKRIRDFGTFITNLDVNNAKLMVKNEVDGVETFEPGCIQPDPTNELLEEMKSINIMDDLPIVIRKNTEKRGGILKPQGSLEKSREEREQLTSSESSLVSDAENPAPIQIHTKRESFQKRTKQNVALQSIFKKLEENKQVKFNVEDNETKASTSSSTPSLALTQQQMRPPPPNQHFNPNMQFQMHQQPDYSMRQRQPVVQNSQNFTFPKTDNVVGSNLKNPGLQMVHYPNFNTKPPPTNIPPAHNFNQPSSMLGRGYQNMQFPPPPNAANFLNDKQQPPPGVGSWWSGPQNFPRPDNNYQMNFANYGSGAAMPPSFPLPNQNEFKPANQPGGDMFNSPWSNFGRSGFGDVGTFENNLRPPDNSPGMHSGRNVTGHDPFASATPQTSQGYTLFNTNTWTPNLVGQLRSTSSKPQESPIMTHLPQQSLFGGSGPKSLAQLLEQQQLQKSDQ